jgi:hypothetical protein
MINIPKTLKVGAHQYEVVFPYQFKERVDICGMSDSRLRRIMVAEIDGNGEKRPDSDILSTFFHEAIHAIDSVYCGFQIGKDCDRDELTESIAQGLAQVYVDNPGFRELWECQD